MLSNLNSTTTLCCLTLALLYADATTHQVRSKIGNWKRQIGKSPSAWCLYFSKSMSYVFVFCLSLASRLLLPLVSFAKSLYLPRSLSLGLVGNMFSEDPASSVLRDSINKMLRFCGRLGPGPNPSPNPSPNPNPNQMITLTLTLNTNPNPKSNPNPNPTLTQP